jgi:hypothetical protein
MRNFRLMLLALVVLSLAAGCKDPTGPGDPGPKKIIEDPIVLPS